MSEAGSDISGLVFAIVSEAGSDISGLVYE
jgi:hypothetical protein